MDVEEKTAQPEEPTYRRSLHTIPLEDEEAIAKEGRRLAMEAVDESADWREEGEKAFAYRDGKQRPNDLRQSAMYLIFNLISHRVLTKMGILTADKPRANVVARDSDDGDTSASLKDLIEKGADEDRFDHVTQSVAMDMLSCGLGGYEEGIDFNEDRFAADGKPRPGKITVGRCNPLEFAFGPNNRSASMTGKDADWYYVHFYEKSVEDLIMENPDREGEILELGSADDDPSQSQLGTGRRTSSSQDYNTGKSNNQQGDADGDSLDKKTVYNIHYKKRIPYDILMRKNDFGEWELAVDAEDRPLTRDFYDELEEEEKVAFKKPYRRIKTEVWHLQFVGDVVLKHEKSIYAHGKWQHVFMGGMMRHNESMPYGEISRLIDTQDLFNRLITLFVDNAIRVSHSGMLIDESAFSEEEKGKLQRKMSKPGWKAFVKKGKGRGAITYVEPPKLPDGLFNLADAVRVLFDELSSLANVQRGGMPYDTSGKAIIALQRAGDTAMALLHGNIENAITEWGRLRLSNIIQFTTFKDAWRISDEVRKRAYKIIAERMDANFYDSLSEEELNSIEPPEEMENQLALVKYEDGNPVRKILIADMSNARFDIKVTLGSGHERSEEEKRKTLELVYEATGDVQHLLEELEVEGWPDIIDRMEKKDQLKLAGEEYMAMMEDDRMAPILKVLSADPDVIRQAVEQSGTTVEDLAASLNGNQAA